MCAATAWHTFQSCSCFISLKMASVPGGLNTAKPVLDVYCIIMDRSQNISLHFICITLHLHYITFAFKNRATSARNA